MADWTAHYEALRAHAMGEAPVEFVPFGLGVLYRRGVAAWMACEALARCSRAPTPVREELRMKIETELSPLQSELVRLLAGAALLTTTTRRA